MTTSTSVDSIVHFTFKVFKRATVDTEILVLRNAAPAPEHKVNVTIASSPTFEKDSAACRNLRHKQKRWIDLDGKPINIFLTAEEELLQKKISHGKVRLDELCKVNVGIKPYQVGKGKPRQTRAIVETRSFDSSIKKSREYRQYLRGSDITAFKIQPIELRFIKYGPWLAEPRPAADFDADKKILMRQTGDSLVAALDDQKLLALNNMHVIVPKQATIPVEALTAILNSDVLNWYYQTLNPEQGEALAEVKKTHVASLPIPPHDNSDQTWRQLIKTAKSILDVSRRKTEAARKMEEMLKIESNNLVCKLYGLTESDRQMIQTPSI